MLPISQKCQLLKKFSCPTQRTEALWWPPVHWSITFTLLWFATHWFAFYCRCVDQHFFWAILVAYWKPYNKSKTLLITVLFYKIQNSGSYASMVFVAARLWPNVAHLISPTWVIPAPSCLFQPSHTNVLLYDAKHCLSILLLFHSSAWRQPLTATTCS